jgi:hypothetical protein
MLCLGHFPHLGLSDVVFHVSSLYIASLSCTNFWFCVCVTSRYVVRVACPAAISIPFCAIVCWFFVCSFDTHCYWSCGCAVSLFFPVNMFSSLCFSSSVPRSPPFLPFSTTEAQLPRVCLVLGCAVRLYGESLAWCLFSEQEKHVTCCPSYFIYALCPLTDILDGICHLRSMWTYRIPFDTLYRYAWDRLSSVTIFTSP